MCALHLTHPRATHLEQWTDTHTPGAVDTPLTKPGAVDTYTPGAVDTHLEQRTHTHTHTTHTHTPHTPGAVETHTTHTHTPHTTHTPGAVGSQRCGARGQLGVRCLAQGSHLSRGQFLPEPRTHNLRLQVQRSIH